jgi:rhodanese-related sulfurtransferase
VALALRRRGVTRVRPLDGGFAGWQAGELPVEAIALVEGATPAR